MRKILTGLQEARGARERRQLGAQTVDHLAGADLPFLERLQGDDKRIRCSPARCRR